MEQPVSDHLSPIDIIVPELGQRAELLDHFKTSCNSALYLGVLLENFCSRTLTLLKQPSILKKICTGEIIHQDPEDMNANIYQGVVRRIIYKTIDPRVLLEETKIKMREKGLPGHQQLVIWEYRFFGVNGLAEFIENGKQIGTV